VQTLRSAITITSLAWEWNVWKTNYV